MRMNDTQVGFKLGQALLILAFLSPALGRAALFERGAGGMVRPFRAHEMPLADFAREYGRFTGREMTSSGVFEKEVAGKVTLLMRRPLTDAALEQLFFTVLDSNGYAALESANGRGWTIHRQRDARDLVLPTYEISSDASDPERVRLAGEHRLVTVTYRLKHAVAEPAARTARSYMPAASRIIPFEKSVMITDQGRNIHKVLALIDRIDTEETVKWMNEERKEPAGCEPREINIDRLSVDKLEVKQMQTSAGGGK